MTDGILLDIQHVSRVYPDGQNGQAEGITALQDVSLSVGRGEFVSLLGPSGCGKTTLLRLLAGLDTPQSGKLLLNGQGITGTSPQRGYVFQQGGLFPWWTVEQNIAAGLKARHVYRREKARVAEFLELVGLQDFAGAYPHQISGGMAQRAAIARSLINDPEVLLLDEPMGALDSFTRADLQDKLLELQRVSGTTMILVTHDIDEAVYLSDRIAIMTPRPGRISEVVTVSMEKPRQRSSQAFTTLRGELLEKFHLASQSSLPEYAI